MISAPFLFITPQNTQIDLRIYSPGKRIFFILNKLCLYLFKNFAETMKEICTVLTNSIQKNQNEKLALNKIKNESIIKYQSKNHIIRKNFKYVDLIYDSDRGKSKC